MKVDLITAVVLSVILNLLITFVIYRFLRPRLMGMKGDCGRDGKSAYVLALDAGYKGTLEDFLKDGFVKPKPANRIGLDGRKTSQPHGTSPN